MALSEFALPDVGEGLTEAEIVSWKVKSGDRVAVNQVLVEIETAKSLVELPSPFAGTVSALLVEEGETVEVGTPIISVDALGTPAAVVDEAATAASIEAPEEKPGAVLVGYGTAAHGGSRRGRAPGSGGPRGSDATAERSRAGGIRCSRQAADPQAREGSRCRPRRRHGHRGHGRGDP